MKLEITYPSAAQVKDHFGRLRQIFFYLFVASGILSAAVNLCVGGPAWSVIAIWGMWGVWQCVLSPDQIERNPTSQTVKALWYICILLWLMDWLIVPVSTHMVIPILGFAALAAACVFFFIDMRAQSQSSMPLIYLSAAGLLYLAAAALGWVEMTWPVIVLGGMSGALIFAAILLFPGALFRELRKRFHLR